MWAALESCTFCLLFHKMVALICPDNCPTLKPGKAVCFQFCVLWLSGQMVLFGEHSHVFFFFFLNSSFKWALLFTRKEPSAGSPFYSGIFWRLVTWLKHVQCMWVASPYSSCSILSITHTSGLNWNRTVWHFDYSILGQRTTKMFLTSATDISGIPLNVFLRYKEGSTISIRTQNPQVS